MWFNTVIFDDDDILCDGKYEIERLREKEIRYLRLGLFVAFLWNVYTIYYYRSCC